MEIELRDIAIVRESSVRLDGLTVVAGKNESGKTTIGKAIYALLNALSNYEENAKEDKLNYIFRNLRRLSMTSEVLDAIQPLKDTELRERFQDLLNLAFWNVNLPDSKAAEKLVNNLELELSDFQRLLESDSEEILSDPALQMFLSEFTPMRRRRKSPEEEAAAKRAAYEKALPLLRVRIASDLKSLRTLLNEIKIDPDLTSYVWASLQQSLNQEFVGQIQPVNRAVTSSGITLRDDAAQALEVKIQEKNGEKDRVEKLDFLPKSLQNQTVFFFDDLSIFDQATESGRLPFRTRVSVVREKNEERTFFNPGRVTPHAAQLRAALQIRPDAYETVILDEKLSEIREKINAVVPGKFLFAPSGIDDYLQPDGSKLHVANMSSGSKTFAAMKILLESGQLNENTTLILDEPEIHLHPEWQNQFAEVVVLLVKELHVRVFLTTHSPNFLLALDAMMRQYDIMERSHFYLARRVDEKSVTHEDVTGRLNAIYSEFVSPLAQMDVLRNQYEYADEDDEYEDADEDDENEGGDEDA